MFCAATKNGKRVLVTSQFATRTAAPLFLYVIKRAVTAMFLKLKRSGFCIWKTFSERVALRTVKN